MDSIPLAFAHLLFVVMDAPFGRLKVAFNFPPKAGHAGMFLVGHQLRFWQFGHTVSFGFGVNPTGRREHGSEQSLKSQVSQHSKNV